jgi:uncharacterized protein (TIGR00730 family)
MLGRVERVCVFCGSNVGNDPEFAVAAVELGVALATRDLALVYGGGRVGLMGTLADAVLSSGGTAIGVIPEALEAKEIAHNGLTELHVTGSMHERKAMMADLADAFVALPGGMGTWEELLEILTWAQLGVHVKPVVVLDVGGFYAPLFALIDAAVAAGFVRPEHASLAHRATSVDAVLELLAAPPPPPLPKWIDRDET